MTLRLPHWAVSLADLFMLLLGVFVFLHARDRDVALAAQSTRAALGSAPAPASVFDRPAAALFDAGEARLSDAARMELKAIGASAARLGKSVVVESRGSAAAGQRLDSWELSAARTAAIGRALREGGLEEKAIRPMLPAASEGEHRLSVRIVA